MSNGKKDLIDFLIEYLVVSNYSNNCKININEPKKIFKNNLITKKKIIDFKLEKFSDTNNLEKAYSKYNTVL
jgi:hypothetical protein